MRFCKDCSHYENPLQFGPSSFERSSQSCSHPQIKNVAIMVLGEEIGNTALGMDAVTIRLHAELCGQGGRWWEEKVEASKAAA
jgi:hypothetical protein